MALNSLKSRVAFAILLAGILLATSTAALAEIPRFVQTPIAKPAPALTVEKKAAEAKKIADAAKAADAEAAARELGAELLSAGVGAIPEVGRSSLVAAQGRIGRSARRSGDSLQPWPPPSSGATDSGSVCRPGGAARGLDSRASVR